MLVSDQVLNVTSSVLKWIVLNIFSLVVLDNPKDENKFTPQRIFSGLPTSHCKINFGLSSFTGK